MLTPAFAPGEIMTDGGNYTEGNMTGSGYGRKRNGNTSNNDTISRMHIHKIVNVTNYFFHYIIWDL